MSKVEGAEVVLFDSIASVGRLLGERDYIADPALAISLFLAVKMGRPFVDDFLPIHNLQSLRTLAAHLSRLPSRRTRRSPARATSS